jgi:hypothetical protein
LVGVPVYDVSNADHVLHVFEDWSTYASINAIGTTARVDGGGSWINSDPGRKTFSTTNTDPWFGRKTVTIDLQDPPADNTAHQRGFVLIQNGTPARFLNADAVKASIVIEWAMRQSGSGIYLGKIADWNPAGPMYRFNFQNNWDRLGSRAYSSCDPDPLCRAYYTNNGQTARFPGPAVPADLFGDQFARSFIEPADPNTIRVHHWNQNRNFGRALDQYDPAVVTENSTGLRTSPFLDNVWRRYIIRLTLNQPGLPPGHGRVEQWMQRAGGPMVKIMEFVGDVGGFDQGLIHTGPSEGRWINGGAGLHWYDLTAVGQIYNGGTTLHLGYFRMWSHSRE